MERNVSGHCVKEELRTPVLNDVDKNIPSESDTTEGAAQGAVEGAEYESNKTLEMDILHSLGSFITEVSCAPGKFDKHIGILLRDFKLWAKSEKISIDVAKLIIEKSVTCQNFRYSGARFLTMLLNKSREMKDPTFWDCLQLGLNMEKTIVHEILERDQHRLCGLLMFLAELFVQLDEERDRLGGDICFIIGMLLFQKQGKSTETIRYVCQSLKLSGRYLDINHSKSMDQIFDVLTQLSEQTNCDRSVYNQITSLIAFRNSNWGESPSVTQQDQAMATSVDSKSIYCGPDGSDLSAEESRFLEENLNEPGDDDFKKFQELWEAEDPMNELDDAFEEFLRFSKQE